MKNENRLELGLFILVIGIALVCLKAFAALPASNIVDVPCKWLPDTNQMAGLGTNDYCTNIVALYLSTKDVSVPTNLWPAVAAVPVTNLLTQGPPGSVWHTILTMDGFARFYAVVFTNGNGGASPFSNLAPGLTAPASGVVLPLKVTPP